MDTCKGAQDHVLRNAGPPGSGEETEEQSAESGSEASILSKHLPAQFPCPPP